MSTLREAAQQALEALEKGVNIKATEWHQAIYDLRAALAREQAEPGQEPAAWRITDGEGDWEYRTDLPEDWSIQWSARYGRKYEPLYTAPPQRKPLTDEEIEVAAKSVPAAVYELMHGHEITVGKFRAALAEFARAIERKLEEKNRGR